MLFCIMKQWDKYVGFTGCEDGVRFLFVTGLGI